MILLETVGGISTAPLFSVNRVTENSKSKSGDYAIHNLFLLIYVCREIPKHYSQKCIWIFVTNLRMECF